MDAVKDTTPATDTKGVPYVGMRPFDCEERDWFYGRDSDAQFLVDKVLSARLTLLYAPSGVGKSSLLRARVIPSLEEEDCRVLYFDAWAGAQPESALKHKLAAMAVSAGIADPLVGAPTLTELARLTASDGKTLVLLLDQFEEFLINHHQGLDPFRSELAALVRAPSVDARVLISLREEFLAAIEPFRPEILTLFQSTYRLESLSADKVRDAVVKPAARFGGDVEPALVDRLIADLSEGATDGASDHPAPADVVPARGWRMWSAHVLDRVRGRRATPVSRSASVKPAPIRRVSGAAIDLPMLQLVCESLWDAAPAVDGRKALTLHFYQTALGGKQRILDRHIRSRMPPRWHDRFFTATLMRYLAPPSGLKISYSTADLSAYSGLESARVQAELDRLSGPEARILRQREFKDSVRYELQHDALIRHITPWRDEVLAEAETRRRVQLSAAAVALIIALVGVERMYHWREVRQNTARQLRDLSVLSNSGREQRAATTFESVARYLLFQESGSGRFDDLKSLLVENQGLLPDSYTNGAAGLDVLPPLGSAESALTFRYSTDRHLDVQSFSRAWSEVAQEINGSWGIPVPKRMQLRSDRDIPRRAIQVESGEKTLLSFDADTHEDMAIVFVKDAPEAAVEFHRYFEQDWQELPDLRNEAARSDSGNAINGSAGEGGKDGTWWAVPRWSFPVWRAAGLRVWPGSAYPALAINARLRIDPTPLLTPAAAEFLVQRVAQEYPCTAAEVAAVWDRRGGGLSQGLVAWMRGADDKPRPLLHPHLVFDTLANPDIEGAAKKALSSSSSYLAVATEEDASGWPLGPSPPCEMPPEFGAGSRAFNATFREIEGWLPQMAPKVRIALGADLVRAWTNDPETITRPVTAATDRLTDATAGQTHAPASTTAWTTASRRYQATSEKAVARNIRVGISRELAEAVERFREDVYERSGMLLPEVIFQNASSELSGDQGRHFRVLMFDNPDDHGTPLNARSADRSGIGHLIAALEAAVSPSLPALVDAESVRSILTSSPRAENIGKELGISATDLKRLMRRVIDARSPETTQVQTAVERTVRESEWLIASLVFWKTYYEHERAPKVVVLSDLTERMRRLQATRQAPRRVSSTDAASDLIQRGIAALDANRVSDAERLFEQALSAAPRATVEDAFVNRYSAQWRARRLARAAAACPKPLEGTLDLGRRTEVAALLEETESQRDRRTVRDLALCLLSSMPATMPRATAALRLQIAKDYGDPESWPEAQSRWLGLQLLEQYDPLSDPPAALERGTHFLNAALRRLPNERYSTFNEVLSICLKPGMRNWCWSLLGEIAEAYPDPWMSLEFAVALSNREPDAQRSVTWGDRAERLFAASKVSPEDRERFHFWADYVKANAVWVSSSGDPEARRKAQESFSALIEAAAVKADAGMNATAHGTAINLMLTGPTPDREKVAALIESGLTIAGHEATFLSRRMFSGLRFGDTAAVKSAVDRAAEKAFADEEDSSRSDLLFVAAVGGLMIGHERAEWAARQFIRTTDPNALLVLMLLRAGTGVNRDDASRMLEDRWRVVDRTTWETRLQGGDGQVWYEMLLGFSLDQVPATDIFEPLRDDATFAASKFARLPFTRIGMQTEAYFYDAVRLNAKGDHAREMANLQQVVDLDRKTYIEYDLAQHLLRQGSKGK